MYDTSQTLALIDQHRWPLLAVCGVAIVANWVWFIEAYRVARRERAYSIPLFCTFFWLAHDSSVVYRFDTWFSEIDHWFPKLWWAALVLTVLFELAFVAQDLRLARPELLPGTTRAQFSLFMLAGIVGGFLVWETVKSILADELYLVAFGLTIVSYPLLAVPLLLRRRSALGQTPLMWGAFTVVCVCYFTASASWFGEAFRDWKWITLGVLGAAAGATMTFVTRQLRTTGRSFGMSAADPVPPVTAELPAHAVRR